MSMLPVSIIEQHLGMARFARGAPVFIDSALLENLMIDLLTLHCGLKPQHKAVAEAVQEFAMQAALHHFAEITREMADEDFGEMTTADVLRMLAKSLDDHAATFGGGKPS